jgi:hypothetical protein
MYCVLDCHGSIVVSTQHHRAPFDYRGINSIMGNHIISYSLDWYLGVASLM